METKRTYRSKALQLSQQILADIQRQAYAPGSFLPAQDELADRYAVCRDTVRRAVVLLTEQGHLLRGNNTPGVRIPHAMSSTTAHVATPAQNDAAVMRAESAGNPASSATLRIGAFCGPQVNISTGIEAYARENNIDLQLFFQANDLADVVHMLRSARDNDLDGIIAYPYPHEEYVRAIHELHEQQLPVVCVDRRIADQTKLCSVEVYNLSGMYQATRHLIEKHRRPVYMLADQGEHSATFDRYTGYCQAMHEAGYDHLIESYTYRMDVSENDPKYWPVDRCWLPAYLATEKLLRQVSTPISVACIYDYAAKGLYEAAAKHGLTIGKDIAVTGFDDLPMAALMTPPLTTVRQPQPQMGYQAARLLHRLITKQTQAPVHIHLPVELIVRQSD